MIRIFDRISTSLFLCAIATVVLSALMAELSMLSKFLLVICGLTWISAIIAMLCAFVGQITSKSKASERTILLTLIALITGSVFFYRGAPTQNLLGAQDEGYNWATALALLGRGSPDVEVPFVVEADREAFWLTQRPTQAQRAESPEDIGPTSPALGYLFFPNEDKPIVRSVFPIAFPVYAASMGAIIGRTSIFWSNTLLLLGLATIIGKLTCSLTNKWAGVAAYTLSLCFPLHLWISQTGFAELLLSVCAWKSVDWLATDENTDGFGLQASAAAFVAGILPFIKFEGYIASILILLAFLFLHGSVLHRLVFASFWLIGLLISQATVYLSGLPYMQDTFMSLLPDFSPEKIALLSILTCALIGGAAYLMCKKGFDHKDYTVRFMPRLVLGASIATFIYFMWVRPYYSMGDTFYYWPLERDILSMRELTLPRLTWYTTTLGLIGGVAGLLALPFLKPKNTGLWIAVILGLSILFSVAWDHRNFPIQPYAMRRFIAYATPALCLGLGITISLLTLRIKHSLISIITHSALTIGACAIWLTSATPLIPEGARKTILSDIDVIAKSIPTGTTVFVLLEEPASKLSVPLTLIYQKYIWPISGDLHNADIQNFLRAQIESPDADNAKSLILSAEPLDHWYLWQDLLPVPIEQFELNERFLKQEMTERPSQVIERTYNFQLLDFQYVPDIEIQTEDRSRSRRLGSDQPPQQQ